VTDIAKGLTPIFSPQSIAVVGASRRRDSIGFALLHNLVMEQFDGAIYPVNLKARSIHSLKAYPSVSAIPDPVDLAMIVVPRDFVIPVVEECLEVGVKGLVVITAGFSETGEEGAELERQLLQRVRAAGVRMVGPNCMGVLNTDPDISLNATRAKARSASSVSPGHSGSPSSTPPRTSVSASRSSSRWATAPTSPATTWPSSGSTTRRRPSSACTSSRSATRASSPRSPNGWRTRSRSWS
jgi:predicted CoA-binding protein